MSNFKFSVIIPTHNSELGIRKPIESVINQSLDFEENIEIIVIDIDSDDNTKRICYEYIRNYPKNIQYYEFKTLNYPVAKNLAVKKATGEFITFLETNDYYSETALGQVLSFSKEYSDVDLITIPIIYFKNNRKETYLNFPIEKTQKVDLNVNPEYSQLLGLSTFFKKSSTDEIRFLTASNENITLYSQILLNNPFLGICDMATYYCNNIDEKIYPIDEEVRDFTRFQSFVKFNFNFLINKSLEKFNEVPEFIQYNLLNHFKWLTHVKKSSIKLNPGDLIACIQFIDDDLILKNKLLDNDIRLLAFLLKYKYHLNEELMNKLDLNTVYVDNYDIVNDTLHILASATNVSHRNIDIIVNGEIIEKKEIVFPQKDKISLGYDYGLDYSFEAKIPLSQDNKYIIEFHQNGKKLNINFSRPCNFSKQVGYAKSRHYISILKNDTIEVKKKTAFNWIKQEIKALLHMVKEHEKGFEKAIPFRIAYMIGYPFLKNKHIWFYMDRPYETDDNGLHLYKYSINKDSDITKYFVLSSKNKDYNDIKKIGKVLSFKSLKHRYLGMFVENIITSHPDNEVIYPFWGGYPFFAGLLKSNNLFLQHGVLKDDISSWLNKANMNLSLFLVSSHKEYESIFRYPYNYDSDVIQMLGLPRYDTLENKKDKKEIIIMPSWRRNLDHKSKELFKESEFFKRFNSLINNPKLIEIAKKYDYEIIFRPHPKVYDFIELYDSNDYVKIDYDKMKYQTLFNNGSILITDYSSVAFDFAYLYKPVLYYQYGSDYHFNLEDSYYDYETMGFGEIIRYEDELIRMIEKYLENDCALKDEYAKRIDEFFIYTDKNNCKRVYDKIKEIPLKD